MSKENQNETNVNLINDLNENIMRRKTRLDLMVNKEVNQPTVGQIVNMGEITNKLKTVQMNSSNTLHLSTKLAASRHRGSQDRIEISKEEIAAKLKNVEAYKKKLMSNFY